MTERDVEGETMSSSVSSILMPKEEDDEAESHGLTMCIPKGVL